MSSGSAVVGGEQLAVPYDALIAHLPAARPVNAGEIAAAALTGRRLVVLDDDPTGTQTIVDLPVLLTWTSDDVRWAFRQPGNGFFILTNTRSLAPDQAAKRNREIAVTLQVAANLEGEQYVIASRSDSTLRGHYPLETDVLTAELGRQGTAVDGVLIVPAYLDTGRVTIGSVHWTPGEHGMIPVADSESARDATFGFTQSDLRQWVQEKSGGRIAASTVLAIDLKALREGGPDVVCELLRACRNSQPVVVDAVVDSDLQILALAVLQVELEGMNYLYRTGPSFVRARIGQRASSPVGPAQLRQIARHRDGSPDQPPEVPSGLIVVGSHVTRTTRQLERLRRNTSIVDVELEVGALMDPQRRRQLIIDASARVTAELLTGGFDVVLSTSRDLISGTGPEHSLQIARLVSASLNEVVRWALARVRPAFVVAKGGITSADTATLGLGMHRAWARGTILPGIVSIWEPASGSAVEIPYIVFAGNVGDDGALESVVRALHNATPEVKEVTSP